MFILVLEWLDKKLSRHVSTATNKKQIRISFPLFLLMVVAVFPLECFLKVLRFIMLCFFSQVYSYIVNRVLLPWKLRLLIGCLLVAYWLLIGRLYWFLVVALLLLLVLGHCSEIRDKEIIVTSNSTQRPDQRPTTNIVTRVGRSRVLGDSCS